MTYKTLQKLLIPDTSGLKSVIFHTWYQIQPVGSEVIEDPREATLVTH